jgi:arsenite methyltransferase
MIKQSQLKEKIKDQYGKIAVSGNSESCCMPSSSSPDCCSTTDISFTPLTSSKSVGYDSEKLASIPESSILGVGCGNPTKFAHIKEADTVVDLGSGAGIDVFLAANIVKEYGKVIGIDMTEDMLKKARENADKHRYKNVEFRQGDIEEKIPLENDSVDVVISNCVINLTSSKLKTFKEIYRILKPNGNGRMVISDLVTSKEIDEKSVNVENWCSCIDGALTKANYIESIKQAGFTDVEILSEQSYMEMDGNSENEKRQISSISISAIKK